VPLPKGNLLESVITMAQLIIIFTDCWRVNVRCLNWQHYYRFVTFPQRIFKQIALSKVLCLLVRSVWWLLYHRSRINPSVLCRHCHDNMSAYGHVREMAPADCHLVFFLVGGRQRLLYLSRVILGVSSFTRRSLSCPFVKAKIISL